MHTPGLEDADAARRRRERLSRAGFEAELSSRLARDARWAVHTLFELVERGCSAPVAVRITAPLDEERQAA